MTDSRQKAQVARFALSAHQVGAKTLPNVAMYLAIVFVPFQQAFTLNVGFPLKVSELLAMLAIGGYLLNGQKAGHKAVGLAFFLALGLLVELSTMVHLVWPPVASHAPGYSGGLMFDLVQYAVYGFVVLIAGWLAATRLGPDRIGEAFGVAVRLAAAYCVLQVGLYLVGGNAILQVVNGVVQTGTAYGISFPRNGPFLEGNYLGFFAGAAIFMCARRKDSLGVVLGISCVLYSQSTVGLFATAAAALVILTLRPNARAVTVFAFLGAVAAGAVAFIPRVSDFVLQQLAKVGFAESERESVSYSLRSRTRATDTGIDMGLDNPVFGVGSGRFGFWHKEYVDYSEMPLGFTSDTVRPIANNSYVQILAELGVPAAILFVLLLATIGVALFRQDRIDLALCVFLIVGLSATPAWTALPIWFIFAYLISAARRPGPVDGVVEVLSNSLSDDAHVARTPPRLIRR